MSQRYYEWSLLLIRLVLGVIFLAHGLQKIEGFDGVTKFFASLGLPFFMAYVVTAIETVGGIALIIGLFPRLAALGIASVMLGAIITVKISKGLINGYEFELCLLSMALAVVLSGSNTLALGDWLFRSKKANSKIQLK